MNDIPENVIRLLSEITARFPILLDGKLTGVYLYGSLTQNAFDPERSDIDCIAVTSSELSDEEFGAVDRFFGEQAAIDPWTERLQMTFLIRDEVLVMDSKACGYQFGKFRRCGSDGNPIIWLNVLESGVTLCGAPPREFVPEITKDVVYKALVRETVYLRDEFERAGSEWRGAAKYKAYAVLTLCRILYTLATGKVASKPVAAAWAGDRLPEKFRVMAGKALEGRGTDLKEEKIKEFIELVSDSISDAGLRIIDL